MIKKTPIFSNKKIKLCSRTLSGQNVFDMQNKVLTKNHFQLTKRTEDKWTKYLGNKHKKLSKHSFSFCWMRIYTWLSWKIVKEIKIKKIKKATIYFELYSNYIVSSFGSVNSKNLIKIILIHEQNTFLRFLIMLHMKLF